MIRDLELKDLMSLEKIHNGQYPLPGITSRLYPVIKVIEVDGKLLGCAYLHLTSEVSLVLDQELSNFTKAELIREFCNILPQELTILGLAGTHVFLDDNNFAEALKKHFNFKEVKDKVLFLGV